MAIVFVENGIEIALRGEHSGRPVVNVLHFANDEGAQSDAAKMQDVVNNWQDHMMEFLDAAYTFLGADWRSLDPDDLNQGTIAPDTAKRTAGALTGQALPPNVAFLVKKVTNNRQRGQRDGRMFLAGVPAAVVGEAGDITPGNVTEYQGYLDLFLDGVNDDAWGAGGGSGLIVLNTTPASRMPGTQEVTLTYRSVSSLVLDAKVSTQRDRLR